MLIEELQERVECLNVKLAIYQDKLITSMTVT